MRLGLIEAFIAALQSWAVRSCIRGACASASLKLGANLATATIRVLYPRRMRLGLIEARTRSASARTRPEYPRRMRLGLIEAIYF